jgi:hypothetical protein
MNLNFLISKYVDGDLTVEEDQLLRRLISENPMAKEAFDAATVLHFTMLEDSDSIAISNDFLSETEAKITSKFIEKEASIKAALKLENSKIQRNRATRFGSAVAALFLICTVPLGDLFVNIPFQLASNETIRSVNSQPENTEQLILHSKRNTHRNLIHLQQSTNRKSDASGSVMIAATIGNSSVYPSENAGIDNLTEVKEVGTPSPALENTLQNPSLSTFVQSSLFAMKSNGRIPASVSGTTFGSQAMTEQSSTQSDNTEIQVSTFISNNVATNHENTASATAISQSIAYSIGENNRIGLEIGYKGYNYQGGGTVLVPRGTPTVLSKSKILSMDSPDIGTPGDVSNPTAERASQSRTEGFDEKKVEYSMDKTMYWGAAFYEHTIFHKGDISVNGRIGAGGSNDGAMAFSRAFARYDVVKGVALTLGAEANTFMLRMPMLSGNQGEVTSSISLVYGMQIKF